MLSAQLFRLEPVWSRVHRHRRIRGGWGRAVWPLSLAVLLGLWAAPAMALAAPPPPSPKLAPQVAAPGASPGSSSSSPQWVSLDGRRILELRSVAGAQSLESVANRGSALLQELARKGTVAPEQLVVQEDPPYSMIGVIDAKGQFKPYLAVDDRAGRAFATSRQELAELYRDQLRGAIRQYRSTHSLTSWIRGTGPGLAGPWGLSALAAPARGFQSAPARGSPPGDHHLAEGGELGRQPSAGQRTGAWRRAPVAEGPALGSFASGQLPDDSAVARLFSADPGNRRGAEGPYPLGFGRGAGWGGRSHSKSPGNCPDFAVHPYGDAGLPHLVCGH
jgi:hypothetical protein